MSSIYSIHIYLIIMTNLIIIKYSDAGTEGARGPMDPPIVGRSVNPIPTGEGRLSPPITTGPPNIFHLPASLNRIVASINLIYYI